MREDLGRAWTRPRAPFGWYGSKGRLAPRIVQLMCGIGHRVYIEPYAGSAAVLFTKARAPVEIINDIDGQVVKFFQVLRDRPAELARACQLGGYARAEYESIDLDAAVQLGEVEQARRFWTRCTQSFNNGGAGRRAGWAISSARGSNEARSTAGLAAQLEAIAARLSGVYIECADALDLVQRYASPDVLIYADPRLRQTRTGLQRSRRGDYEHEAPESHHRDLAAVLRANPAAALVSGYDHPLYRELYADWHCVEIRVAKPSANHAPGGRRYATELVWSNRPLTAEIALFGTPEQYGVRR